MNARESLKINEKGHLEIGGADSVELASKFGVFSIPTLVVLKDGKEKTRSVGAKPKDQLIALLNG